MQQNGPVDLDLTLMAWADIVIDKWKANIENIPRVDTGTLRDSLKQTLFVNAGNDIDKIEFSFKLYGIFVDMGAGRGRLTKYSLPDDFWFSRKYYGQVMKLKELLAEKYRINIFWSVKNTLEAPMEGGTRLIER